MRGDAGYALSRPRDGMPRFSIGGEALTTLRLAEGRYAARVEAGASSWADGWIKIRAELCL